jgi:tRNA-dihydrouridine synthase
MQKNFWSDLYTKNKGKRPIIVLAPMADVTDIVFRNLIVEKSGIGEGSELDVLWSEFVSVNGLSHPVGREKLLVDLRYREAERPIVAQVFGEDPDKYEDTAKLCQELGFDGVDINMGCPDKNVLGQKAGSYLINIPEVAKKIVENTKLGAPNIPVTIKTRIGYNEISYEKWLSEILQTKPQVITIHLRTKKEMSLVPAHWELAADIVVNGIILAGGGSLLANLDILIKEKTGLPVALAEDPLTCVVRGSGKVLKDIELLRQVTIM